MIGANKKKSDFATPYTVSNALTKGGAAVKLSALIMGLGNIAHKQIIKGLIFLAIEIGYIMFMVNAGAYYLSMLPSLGWRKQEEVSAVLQDFLVLAAGNRKRYGMKSLEYMSMYRVTIPYYCCYTVLLRLRSLFYLFICGLKI